MCTWSGYHKNPTDFPRNIHIEYCPSKFFTISSQIQVCCSLIYSKESSIASGSRAIYHTVFKNRPKKFLFPYKYPHRILSEQILHYQLPNSGMLFFDIFQRKLHSIWFKGYHAVFKNHPKKFSFPKKYAHRILSKQILHYQLTNSDMLFFDIFQRKLHSIWLKGYHTIFKNCPKKFLFP